jgi:uncharacterized protein (DUF362 family)
VGPPEKAADGQLSRRRFLRGTAVGTAAIMAGAHLIKATPARAQRMSKVVRTCHPDATTGWSQVNQEPVNEMVAGAIRELTGIYDLGEAWKNIFPGITADKTIGIKISLACGDVPTHPEVVNAIIDGLLAMDLGGGRLPEENIVVWDRLTERFCPQTGYPINYGGPGVQYYGTDYVGFDYSRTCTVLHPGGVQTTHHPSLILSETCDYIINAGVIKDHDDYAGVTLSLKNWYGGFDNIGIGHMHYSYFTTGIPHLSMYIRDELNDKIKLHLIDGTYGMYDGGPGYVPPYHTPPNWIYNSLIASFDTVAIDRIGTEAINAKRIEMGLGALDPSHVTSAGQPPYNLGVSDLGMIDLVEIDVSQTQSIPERGRMAGGAILLPPFPNPARGDVTLRFRCQQGSKVQLMIVDATGAVVRHLASGHYAPGLHTFHWDGRDRSGRRMSKSAYFCRLKTSHATHQEQILLLR